MSTKSLDRCKNADFQVAKNYSITNAFTIQDFFEKDNDENKYADI